MNDRLPTVDNQVSHHLKQLGKSGKIQILSSPNIGATCVEKLRFLGGFPTALEKKLPSMKIQNVSAKKCTKTFTLLTKWTTSMAAALLYKDHQFSGTTVDGRNPVKNHQGCIEPCE